MTAENKNEQESAWTFRKAKKMPLFAHPQKKRVFKFIRKECEDFEQKRETSKSKSKTTLKNTKQTVEEHKIKVEKSIKLEEKKATKSVKPLTDDRIKLIALMIQDLEKNKAFVDCGIDLHDFSRNIEATLFMRCFERINSKYWKLSDLITHNLGFIFRMPLIAHQFKSGRLSVDSLLLSRVNFARTCNGLTEKWEKCVKRKKNLEEKLKQKAPKVNLAKQTYNKLMTKAIEANEKKPKPINKLATIVHQVEDDPFTLQETKNQDVKEEVDHENTEENKVKVECKTNSESEESKGSNPPIEPINMAALPAKLTVCEQVEGSGKHEICIVQNDITGIKLNKTNPKGSAPLRTKDRLRKVAQVLAEMLDADKSLQK